MKFNRATTVFIAIIAMWVVALPVSAVQPKGPSDDVGLNIVQTVPVQFPNGVTLQGLHSGKVRLVVSVDAAGNLVDCLVVAYTHEAFVSSAVQAVKEWKFEPARVSGQPRASRADLDFVFKSDLVVTVQNAEYNFLQDIFGHLYKFEPSKLKDLDRIPVPIHVVSPVMPDGTLAEGDVRVVTVEFYIDQEGKVRVPSVSRELVDDRLAAAAVNAVEQWRFEPPMRRSRPVLVLAQQDFRFVARSSKP